MDGPVLDQHQQLPHHISAFQPATLQALHDAHGLASQLNPPLASIHNAHQTSLPRYQAGFVPPLNAQYYASAPGPLPSPSRHAQSPHQGAIQRQQASPSTQFTNREPRTVTGRKRTWAQSNDARARQETILPAPTRPGQDVVSRASEVATYAENVDTDPPSLKEWRELLFNVEEMITLTEEEFSTYFPHVDNVYSHRSTQKYKKNPFIAHYWDCRLKGRPPGTKKSEDPSKRKRKRIARERDQCEVKIKIVEFFPHAIDAHGVAVGAETKDGQASLPTQQKGGDTGAQPDGTWKLPLVSSGGASVPEASAKGSKIYTIQRVSGTTGQQDSHNLERHKHSLEYSDQVKKNSVERAAVKTQKDKKRQEKTYHKKASGNAFSTVKKRSAEHELKLYGSCFCPFVQRVWIALELKQIQYQYIEVDPYSKPKSLLDINPRGLVPALRHGEWGCYESTVLMEYLEDLKSGTALLPESPQTRAYCRLWSDHINRHIIPSFYHYLQAQETEKQIREAQALSKHIDTLVSAADATGPFFLGSKLSFVDVQMAPWVIRLNRVLKPYRGWPDPEPGSRWERWVQAIEEADPVKATTSEDILYLDSYQRYAENRPDTSQLAKAVNEGRGLP